MIMQRLIGLILITLGVYGIAYLVSTITLDKNLAATRQEYLVISGVKAKKDIKNPSERRSDFYYQTKQKLQDYNNSPRALFRTAQASLELGLNEIGSEKQNELLCSAYRNFDRAHQLSPLNPDYLLGRAQSETMLIQKKASCSNFNPSKEHILTAINTSLTNAPFQLSTLRQASDILLLLEENTMAFRLVNKIQSLDASIADEQKYWIYSLAKTSDDIDLLIPESFPQIVDWINFFSQQRRSDLIEWQAQFTGKTKKAIINLKTRLDANYLSIPEYSQFIKEISHTALVNYDDSLRKELDQLLSNIYDIEENPSSWSAILKERQNLDRIRILKAVIEEDKSPATTMLTSWFPDSSDYFLSLKEGAMSIGVYIPPTSIPRLLFIEPKQPQSSIDLDALTFLASEDNMNFYDFSSEVSLSQTTIDGKTLIIARINKPAFRYLKIYFKKIRSQIAFSNSLADLIQVYGVNTKNEN